MKPVTDGLKCKSAYIVGQKMIQPSEDFFGIKFFGAVKMTAVFFRMNPAVGSAAARKGGTESQNPLKGVLHLGLNREGVFLNLPAVIGRSDIAYGQKIPHKTILLSANKLFPDSMCLKK